jgi:hypothetical protein
MKTKKTVYLALFALVICCALITFGCDDPAPTPTETNFSVTVNTPSGGNSDRLEFTFSSAVTGLTKDMINITPGSGKVASGSLEVTKGNLIGSDTKWSLSITVGDGFADTYSCSVSISKPGVTSSSQNKEIIKNTGTVDFQVIASKVKNNSSDLTIKLSKNVDLSDSNIIIKDGSGNTVDKTTLLRTDNQGEYKLTITGVAVDMKISVSIEKEGVTTTAKSFDLGEEPTTTEPQNPKPADTITIMQDDSVPYSTIQAAYQIENGYPKKFKAVITPETANQEVEWSIEDTSIATVDKKTGLVTPKYNVTGETRIIAKATDSSGKGTSSKIEVVSRVYPTKIKIEIGSNTAAGGYNNKSKSLAELNGGNESIGLILGDIGLKFIVGLYSEDKLTNDQSILPSSYTSTKFTLSSVYPEPAPPKGAIPRRQYTLTPLAESTEFETINIRSDYRPDTIRFNLNTSVGINPVKTITYQFLETITPEVTLSSTATNSLNFNNLKSDKKDTIYVKITTDAPYDNLTFKSTSSVTISEPANLKDPLGKYRLFQATRNNAIFTKGSSSIDIIPLTITGRDKTNNIVESGIAFSYGD